MKYFIPVLLALLLVPISAPAMADSGIFPRPVELEPDVRFWTRIYTEVGTDSGFIHDSRHLGVIYETVQLPANASSRTRQRVVDRHKKRIKAALQSLARGRRSGLSAEERRILSLWPSDVSNATLRAAAGRLRFQLGQANKFRAGLVRSGAWEPHIRQTLRKMDLPIELAALPHVESSYTPNAYSHIGAAGLWQFTRSTGRRFMRVDHVVDERLDPWKATVSAARLLEQNRQTTGSWPLAITAYNHGAAGMRRAVRQLGTRNIATIVRKYKSRTFGFASRNFYVEFLAAVDVDFHSEKYFGPLLMDSPIDYETLEMPYFTSATALQRTLGIDRATLKESNPALRPSVWNGAKYVPQGYTVRVPRAALARPLRTAVASIPSSERHARQLRDTYHVVRRGETLSRIARRYGLRQSDIVALNNLRSVHRIRAGQKLRLPDPHGGRRVASAAVVPSEPPADGLYTVRRGDTISKIATRFGVAEQEIIRANGLRNRNRIHVGQRLRLADDAPKAVATSEVEVAAVRTPAEPAVEPPAAEPVAPTPTPTPESEVEASASPGVAVQSTTSGESSETAGALAADPSDYSVAGDGTIEVQAAETLGHYADWLELPTHRLRRLNGLRFGQDIELGRRIELDFSRIDRAEFERRRGAYHRALQEEFFARYEIAGTRVHVMRRGDSLWQLSQRRYRVPVWLLRQYNPDLDFTALHAGTRLTIPLVQPHSASDDSAPAAEPASSQVRVQTRG